MLIVIIIFLLPKKIKIKSDESHLRLSHGLYRVCACARDPYTAAKETRKERTGTRGPGREARSELVGRREGEGSEEKEKRMCMLRCRVDRTAVRMYGTASIAEPREKDITERGEGG